MSDNVNGILTVIQYAALVVFGVAVENGSGALSAIALWVFMIATVGSHVHKAHPAE